MANYEMLTDLLGLAQAQVSHYRLLGLDRIELLIESSLPAAVCPHCQQVSSQVHDTGDPQRLRDLPIWGRRCWLVYAPRRYDCVPCGRTFVERVAWREPGQDYSQRYSEHIYERARLEPVAQVAQTERLSQDIVQSLFERGAKKRLQPAATRS
jgi:transposase